MSEGKSSPINEDSSLYGQYVECALNNERIENLNSILDKAINIVNQVFIKLNKKMK